MDDKQKPPAFVVAIIALLGLFSLPQIIATPDGGTPHLSADKNASRVAASLHDHDDDEDKDRRDLKPLLDYLSDGQPEPVRPPELKQYLHEKLHKTNVHCLLITLPDPIESVASARFDEYLDVVQRAIELQEYTLDRTLLPWKKSARSEEAADDRTTTVRAFGVNLGVTLKTTTPAKPKEPRPGLMVFKHAFTQSQAPSSSPSIVLAFLVPESTITGIKKGVLNRCLNLVDSFFQDKLTLEANSDRPRKVMHIVAPCFSGSQMSLEQALGAWALLSKGEYNFRVISNSADQIDQVRFEKLFPSGDRHRLSFQSMVHHVHTVKDELRDYLTKSLGYESSNVAILIESNTGLMQAMVQHERKQAEARAADDQKSPVEFIYPLQVAEVRKAYAKGGLLSGGKLDDVGAPERLTIPPDEGGEPADLPRSYTPSTSAALDEMALTQVLTTISHRKYQVVGIIATNPFDVVFLAREVHRFCPDVRLFTIHSDLLIARPEEVQDLRGMLVASTYPLYPANQWMTTPFRNGPRVFFSNQGAQGLYNAIVAHLWEMSAKDPALGPQLLEYGDPYDIKSKTVRQPPVWISAVGQRGLYPVTFISGKEPNPYLYKADRSAEGRLPSEWPSSKEPERVAAETAMQPNPHPLFWLLSLFSFFACFAVAGVTWVYVGWSVDEKKLRLKRDIWFFGFGHANRILNMEVAPDGFVGTSYDPQARFNGPNTNSHMPRVGAGVYLSLINLLVLVLSYYFIAHLIMAIYPYASGGHTLRFVPIVLALLAVSVVTASCSLAFLQYFNKFTSHVIVKLKIFSFVIFILTSLGWAVFLKSSVDARSWRLDFERITNLPSGVSPVFPVLFLAAGLAAWIYSHLARRRLYRLSYLRSSPSAEERGETHFEKILVTMRATRSKVNDMIVHPLSATMQVNPYLLFVLFVFLVFGLIRLTTRGWPRSLEGTWFDNVFSLLLFSLVALTVLRGLELRALWRRIRKMLRLAVELPLSPAYDRLPSRFKGWFYDLADDFRVREEIILQQSTALRRRSTDELKGVFDKLFPKTNDPTFWSQRLTELQAALENAEGTLDSTRKVYPFLTEIWSALPVEDIPRSSPAGDEGKGTGADWLASWPLTTQDYSQNNTATITPHEHEIVRDWVRMAEDLIALQIVRWFAPALSQFVPLMQFLVIGSISLLLAVTSYPFDHQGFLMTMLVLLIIFVAAIIGSVLLGVNRDELISRVSDTTPGRFNFDGQLVTSLLTMIVPLIGALLAVSFDLTDLLHTWFGPLFQLL
jgi:hypothetical protein